MVVNQKHTGRALSMPAGLAIGAMWSVGMTIAISALIAKLVEGEVLSQNSIGYWVMGLLSVAALIGSLTAFQKIKRQRLVVCLLSGVIYFAVLLSITALIFGGQFKGMTVTGVMILIGCGAAALLGLRQGREGRRKKIKVPNR